ncbi:hypothetical protein F5Y06DRAFT_307821 [Hypoxylon sp. FL0890]|nr:hypothetical protein F5Y06DRAFT_307821 [Hypoxylon sp. FL0890]
MRSKILKSPRKRPSGPNILRALHARPREEPPCAAFPLGVAELASVMGTLTTTQDHGSQDQDVHSSGEDNSRDQNMTDFAVDDENEDEDDYEDVDEEEEEEEEGGSDASDLFNELPDRTIEEDNDPDDPEVCEPGSIEDQDCLGIGTLTRNGLPAHEPDGLEVPDGQESDIGDEEKPDWDEAIRNFTVRAEYNPQRGHYENGVIGYNFANEFAAYSSTNGYDLRTISSVDMENASKRVEECLGWPNQTHTAQVCAHFEFKVANHREELHQLEVRALERAEDPNHVRVSGLADRYRAWTAVEDGRVGGDGFDSMTPNRYNIPSHRSGDVPMEVYVWFPSEVVSPVLPADSDETARIIERACRTLRTNFRIHKPMEYSTGFHVHLGHQHGWNLLQLKRFATLWFLMERVLIHIHRKDRESEYMDPWMAKFGEGTKLAQSLWHPNAHVRRLVHCLPQTAPRTRARNEAEMERHVVTESLSPRQEEFIRNVWLYTRIDDLGDAMAGGYSLKYEGLMRSAVRMRVTGHKKTNTPNTRHDVNLHDPSKARNAQTLEVRTMHGTVDANHINHWIAVLRRILYYVRRASREEFRELAGNISANVKEPQHLAQLLRLLLVPDRTQRYFFLPHNRDRHPGTGEEWFTYPDKDRVDWDQPFMVPSHGATHGQYYDDMDNN